MGHGKVIATSLQCIGTVGERALVGAQVRRALSELPRMLFSTVSGMGSGLLSEESSSCKSGDELHTEEFVEKESECTVREVAIELMICLTTPRTCGFIEEILSGCLHFRSVLTTMSSLSKVESSPHTR